MMERVLVSPADEHNRKLVGHVHPPEWVNPEPASRYNLVVIGGGTAGLVAAAGAAVLGARVALIERHLMGGDCLNVGCVPSKALLRAARAVARVREAGDYGVLVPDGVQVAFPAVMERMRRLRAAISPHDSAARFQSLGVDVFFGEARFTGLQTLAVDEKRLAFSKAVIATGRRAAELPIPGLTEAGYLTNETLFSLTELPPRLAVIGAGPIGCEMAQALCRFGARVTLLETMPRILIKDDPQLAERVQRALERDGVDVVLGAKIEQVSRGRDAKQIAYSSDEGARLVEVDEILLAVGRAPNVERLGLEAAGVEYDASAGVRVDDHLRTTNRKIFAAGDVASMYQFTHAADAMARVVIQNALFPFKAKLSGLIIPWCTYTDPELAHVGLSPGEAEQRGLRVQTIVQEFGAVDRAVLDGDQAGMAKVHLRQGSDRILGASVVAAHAGEIISEITAVMSARAGLGTIAKTIHPYPTQAEVWKKIGDAYNRARLKPGIKRLLERWFAWTR
ncbi:MAG: mercuric reductase [Acidobacteriota bacterium]|nr:MAG: mercuric reductase [Acidobacteriota bacterium]